MRFRSVIAGGVVIAAAAAWALSRQLPALGAGGLLRLMRQLRGTENA